MIKLDTILKCFCFKSSTSKATLEAMEVETVIEKFEFAKKVANAADAERDRLRKFLQGTPDGQYGRFVLTKSEGTEQCYPNADGKHALQHLTIVDRDGAVQENEALYSLKSPIKLSITEIPVIPE